MLRIGRDGRHRLRRCLEQQSVDRRLVLERDVGHVGGQREDDVEVADQQQVGLALGEPGACGRALAPQAVPVATVIIGNPPVPAIGAGLDVPAHDGGSAMFDGRHDLQLVEAQVPRTGGPVRRTRGTEDVGHLDGGAHAHSAAGRFRFAGGCRQPVEWAGDITQHPGGDLRVIGGGFQLRVPEQRLDDADVDTVLEQVRGEAVPQRMRPTRLPMPAAKLASTTMRCNCRVLIGLR